MPRPTPEPSTPAATRGIHTAWEHRTLWKQLRERAGGGAWEGKWGLPAYRQASGLEVHPHNSCTPTYKHICNSPQLHTGHSPKQTTHRLMEHA